MSEPEVENKKVKAKEQPHSLANKPPGKLRGSSSLTLHTLQAQQLYYGREPDKKTKKPAIIGLRRFSGYLSTVWSGATKQNPFAYWWLVKVEERLGNSEKIIDEMVQEFEGYLHDHHESLTHEESHSIEPIKINLIFSSPYSFRGATLLAEFDKLIRLILTAHHVFAVDSEKISKSGQLAGKAVRGAFESARGYYNREVTFDDLNVNNEKVRAAIELMGQPPAEILTGELKPSTTPNPMANKSSFYGRQND